MTRQPRFLLAFLAIVFLSGCATLPPGSDYPKKASLALANPEQNRLGRQFEKAARKHNGNSGFRIISAGSDGFLVRMQMINAAAQTLDLQYYIFRGDETGRLLTEAVIKAADRGVRVRLLVDDGDTEIGDDQINEIESHHGIEIRIFNPFAYRGHSKVIRGAEFMLSGNRLDYRMHNKVLIVDNAIALIGGRNVGDQYFQIDPESQFADGDVFVAGPIAQRLSGTFDQFWNSELTIPSEALADTKSSKTDLNEHREELQEEYRDLQAEGVDYVGKIASGEPFNGLITGRLPLIWAHAQLVYDTPEKKRVLNGTITGELMTSAVIDATKAAQTELLIVSPYMIPGDEGIHIFKDLRQRNVKVRILTNSLESSTMLLAQSGYMKYRMPMLELGVELSEIRSLLGNNRGSGQTKAISRYGNYSLHAKLFVFDRKRVFIGSMNFDQRSMHINTEIGLIIDSPALAQQIAARFDAMVQPVNSYRLALRHNAADGTPGLVWCTQENASAVEYTTEPARSDWQRDKVNMLTLLPLDNEL
jgi:putative cardiolipin synthase